MLHVDSYVYVQIVLKYMKDCTRVKPGVDSYYVLPIALRLMERPTLLSPEHAVVGVVDWSLL